MTITRKRAFSAVLGSGVAVLGVAACPSANAKEDAPATPRTQATVRHKHAKPRRRHVTTPHGVYVYEATIGGKISVNKANMACSGSTIRASGVSLFPEGKNTNALWAKTPSAWKQRFTITTRAATTITVPWTSEAENREASEHGGMIPHPRSLTATTLTSHVCAATSPNAAIGSIGEGVAIWRLPEPVNSVAALVSCAPASVNLNEYMIAFTVLPNGTVPAFNPYT